MENWGKGGAGRQHSPLGTIHHRGKAAKSPWSCPSVFMEEIRELLLGIKEKLSPRSVLPSTPRFPEDSFSSISRKYFLWEGHNPMSLIKDLERKQYLI